MAVIEGLLALNLLLAPPGLAIDPACITSERLVDATNLAMPTREDDARLEVELTDQNRCAWMVGNPKTSPALLLRLPSSLPGPLLLEIETDLDADSGLAAHVALLNESGEVQRVAPYSSFRERLGARTLRVIVRDTDVPGYLWIGGAVNAWPVIGRRTYRPGSTRALSIIGVVTGTDTTRTVASRMTGDVAVGVTRFAPPVVR